MPPILADARTGKNGLKPESAKAGGNSGVHLGNAG
jgi:hypothetical protein